MYNNFLLKEIDKWEAEEIISHSQAEILKARYPDTAKKNSSVPVLSVIGALFLAVGGTVIIAAFRDNIPAGVKTALSFLPLIISQLTALFALITKKTSPGWREGVCVIYAIGIFSSFKLVELSYQVPIDYARYILCCGIVLFPVILIFRSVIAGAAYLFAIGNWGYIVACSNPGNKAGLYFFLMTVLIAAGILHMLYTTKNDNGILRTFALWFSAGGFFAVTLFFAIITESNIPLSILLIFTFLYALSGKEDKAYSPFLSAGKTGIFILMFMFSMNRLFEAPDGISLINILFILFMISAVIFVFIREHNFTAKKITNIIASLLISAAVFVSDLFIHDSYYPKGVTAFIAACFLVTGIIHITDGTKHNRLSDINIGIVSVFAVMMSMFIYSTGNFTKGLLFFISGAVILTVNIILNKRFKRKNNEMQVNTDEK